VRISWCEWRTLGWAAVEIAIATAGLGGCVVGPDFRRPEPPESSYNRPPATVGQVSLEYGAEVSADWYSLFHSAALDRLVKDALRGNPDLEGARHALRAAHYELQAVAGTALPQVQIDAKVARTRVNGSLLYQPDENLQVTANQFSMGPSLAYDLDIFGHLRRTIESQAAQTSRARHEMLDVYVTLVDQVVVTAFNLAAAAEQIEVTRKLISDQQQQYDLTHTLEDAGKVARTETLQARAQLETTRATLPTLEKQRDVYRNALLKLLGKAPAEDALPAIALQEFHLPTQLPVSLPSKLVRQRPDILQAEDALHAASAGIGIAEAARFPSFDISAQFAQQSIKTSDLFTQPASIWSAGLGVAAPLFEGGTLRARQREAEELFIQARSEYRSTIIGAFVEVTDALQALQHDADSYAAHETALEASQANRDLATQEFERGSVNELVVLTAEQQYQSAALSAVQAQVQRFADAAELFRSLGGGWWGDTKNTGENQDE
jgi:NodT family efflux transporter outer membrane factor (OMF) lipoprotein